MSVDLFAVLATVVGSVLCATIAVIAVMVSGQRGIRSDLADMRDRVSRIKGMLATLHDVILRRDSDRGAA